MKVNEALISALKNKTSQDENPVDLLTDIIPMSKEAAYRRLRGEISLTLDEAVRIAKKLQISIDNLIGIEESNEYCFKVGLLMSSDPLDAYFKLVNTITDALKLLVNDPCAFIYTVPNVLPLNCVDFAMLNKFRSYKWLYHIQHANHRLCLADIEIPQKIIDIQQECFNVLKQIQTFTIWDQDLCLHMIDDLKYFLKLQVISPEEGYQIKEEFLAYMDQFEEIVIQGRYPDGKQQLVYISDAYLDAAYDYLEATDFMACSLNVYGLDYFSCQHKNICEMHKKWIESIMRYSTLISRSGERRRREFFNEQRALIKGLQLVDLF